MPKNEEYQRLDTGKRRVPKWTLIDPETRLDPDEWGPYVVEKPTVGRRGSYVRIRRASRVRYQAQSDYPEGHYGREGPMMAQQFIYTGTQPESYRVYTIFGEVLICYRVKTRNDRTLKSRWDFRSVGGISIVSNTKDMVAELAEDQDVMAFAKETHLAAFPEFPTLAFDIVRDIETGELHVLECHPAGGWPLLSQSAARIQKNNNIDFERQFDLFERAAAALAREVPKFAETVIPLRWKRDPPSEFIPPWYNGGGGSK